MTAPQVAAERACRLRLLWYISEGNSPGEGQMVVGSSRLDEVLVDTPDTLFSKFEHLGIHGVPQITSIASHHAKRSCVSGAVAPLLRLRRSHLPAGLGHTEGTPPPNWTRQ